MKGEPNLLKAGYFIPPKPGILADIQRVQKSPEASITDLAELIAEDVGLSAVVLKTINSPIYGLVRQITDIKQSVMILGMNFVTNLSTYHLLTQAIPESASISLQKFWESSLQTAVLTGMYIRFLGLKREIPVEDAYSAGLFLNCGIPVMALKYPDYPQILVRANSGYGKAFTDIEDEIYNTNHCVIGYYVAKSWDLPDIISCSIRLHHDPQTLQLDSHSTREKDLFALLKMAENTANVISFGQPHCEWQAIYHHVLEHFGLSEDDFNEVEQDVMALYYEAHP